MTIGNETGPRRGGAPVGHLAELPQVEAVAVASLRLWCDGAEGQARLWTELAGALGPRPAREALKAFERMVGLLARHGRRPLMRHHRDCACVGADEAVVALMVAAAAEGEREDAALLAALLVPPACARELGELAGAFGLAVRRMPDVESGRATPLPRAEILH